MYHNVLTWPLPQRKMSQILRYPTFRFRLCQIAAEGGPPISNGKVLDKGEIKLKRSIRERTDLKMFKNSFPSQVTVGKEWSKSQILLMHTM